MLLRGWRLDAALGRAEAALACAPNRAAAHYARAEALYLLRRPAAALAAYDRAMALGMAGDPRAQAAAMSGMVAGDVGWTAAMLQGDFARAWAYADREPARRRAAGLERHRLPRHRRWLWEGQSFAGRRVLVRCYRGLGDAIQFVRLAPLLKSRGGAAAVVIEAPPALLPLFASLAGVDGLAALDGTDAAPPCDLEIEANELPHALRLTLPTIPSRTPYLAVDERLRRAWRGRLGGAPGLRVGLVWSASGTWENRRSIPLAAFRPFNGIPGVALYSLQRGPGVAELETAHGVAIARIPGHGDDIRDAAAIVCELDLVIAADTMMAHLAGALGRPVWTALHAAADWRWLLDRADSPWYPTMRLFRQPSSSPGDDWRPVVAAMAAALRAVAPAGNETGRASRPAPSVAGALAPGVTAS